MSESASANTAVGTRSVRTGSWLRRFHPAPSDAPLLVVLPHAGGSASHYRPLSGALSERLEVLAVQYPGRQDRYREPPVTDLTTLADEVAAALRPMAGRRLALFGHSMGAVVAFETARRLEGEGRPAEALFVSARRAPARPAGLPVGHLDDTRLLAEIQALGGTDERLLHEKELLRMYLPVVRADYRAVEAYACEPGAVVGAPITALAGDTDPGVSRDDAAAWDQHTTSAFDLRIFPGGHFYLDDRPAAVAEVVTSALE